MCRVLGVSPSGYYAWRKRPLSARARVDVELGAQVATIYRESRGPMGCRACTRSWPSRACGWGGSGRAADAAGRPARGESAQAVPTTQRDETARPAPDLVKRRFVATAPNCLWVADRFDYESSSP